MIYVEGLTHRQTIWGDGVSAHLISDHSVAELKDFADYIRIPDYWYQPLVFPHFELSPIWRRRALKARAVNCAGRDRHERYIEAMRRFFDRHPRLMNEPATRDFLEQLRRNADARR